eukprot:TRINITY_DN1320_c0_g1_i1.p1 TRINITY_DN1320_c0_g1~~TRINITY_DN1320_c0_g1_i1.p1  ORF type:complete len:108 (-),score=12.94 TRINITY_DN1320_c0_g1_i1:127-450(-)
MNKKRGLARIWQVIKGEKVLFTAAFEDGNPLDLNNGNQIQNHVVIPPTVPTRDCKKCGERYQIWTRSSPDGPCECDEACDECHGRDSYCIGCYNHAVLRKTVYSDYL